MRWETIRKRYKISREKPQVWILPENNLAYIQIPKIATRSIRYSLMASLDQNLPPATSPDIGQYIKSQEHKHSRHMSHKQIFQLSKSMNIFSFVRNPYHRLYSCFIDKLENAAKTQRKNIFSLYGMSFNTSFSEFVHSVSKIPDTQADRHFRSQAWFLTQKGELLTSHLGRIEHMSDDWLQLKTRYNLAPIPQKNTSRPRTSLEDIYNSELQRVVYNRYQEDFELLEYSRDEI